MIKQLILLVLVAMVVLPAPAPLAEGGSAPSVEGVSPQDAAVNAALGIALQNRPSVRVEDGPKPAVTLDDYTQERWRIKLETIVPYILIATPVILLIVLLAIRFSGVKSPEHTMLAAALVLAIQATLIVSLTAEGSDALSASMGILGAIAGYLFGRARQEQSPPPAEVNRSSAPSGGATPQAPEAGKPAR